MLERLGNAFVTLLKKEKDGMWNVVTSSEYSARGSSCFGHVGPIIIITILQTNGLINIPCLK